MTVALTPSLLILVTSVAVAQELAWQVNKGDTVRQLISISQSDWSIDHILAALEMEPPRGFRQATFVESAVAPQVLPWRNGSDHAGQEEHRRAYLSALVRRHVTSEVIQVKDAGVVRHRDASGRIERRIIGRGDPLIMEVSGWAVEVIHIGFMCDYGTWGRFVEPDYRGRNAVVTRQITLNAMNDDRATVFAIVKTNPWPPSDPAVMATMILDHFRLRGGSVVMRPDRWFYGNGFPVEPAFLPAEVAPPTTLRFRSGPTVVCWYSQTNGRETCRIGEAM